MNQYRTELHCHTSEVSKCASANAADLVACYIDNGYSTIVLTDHYNHAAFADGHFPNWKGAAEHYLSGYRAAKQEAGTRLNVLLGMELTFFENANDYLIFGMTEDFIEANDDLRLLGLAAFRQLAKEEGFLIFQAHPFRNNMTVTNPELLDGIEVYNGAKGHDSRNEIAQLWAEKYGLLKSSGSDFHQKDGVARGGIITEEPIMNNETLIRVLMNYPKLIIDGREAGA